ncbi:P-II family nitrogen regulator [Methanolobus chelungpuianus]|uniref:Nitrogen regulatory protein P-II n=1 Tax=Methanolobus chelungpuianus TaxID=502115 RepID=A0AAE3HBB0_9EURY|nr:P-II family nitrogen regulator [Methanolobus chelungpuianus]MCQ6962994.1 nitrogen regulatory protein P-II [Methanolobus chelungpuianus]
MYDENDLVLIVTIVKKGWGDKVVKASKKAGARGGTIIFGRGTGVNENKSLLGMLIEPEKEVVFTIAEAISADNIIENISQDVGLDKPGQGLGFVVPLERVFGTAQILCDLHQHCESVTKEDKE